MTLFTTIDKKMIIIFRWIIRQFHLYTSISRRRSGIFLGIINFSFLVAIIYLILFRDNAIHHILIWIVILKLLFIELKNLNDDLRGDDGIEQENLPPLNTIEIGSEDRTKIRCLLVPTSALLLFLSLIQILSAKEWQYLAVFEFWFITAPIINITCIEYYLCTLETKEKKKLFSSEEKQTKR